jgi:peptide/nickel transport system substrate-binding protein
MFTLRSGPTAALARLLAGASPIWAETPADTLVIADKIDDIVSLDPAESFEFSGQDALENVYDRLIQIRPPPTSSWSPASRKAGASAKTARPSPSR